MVLLAREHVSHLAKSDDFMIFTAGNSDFQYRQKVAKSSASSFPTLCVYVVHSVTFKKVHGR